VTPGKHPRVETSFDFKDFQLSSSLVGVDTVIKMKNVGHFPLSDKYKKFVRVVFENLCRVCFGGRVAHPSLTVNGRRKGGSATTAALGDACADRADSKDAGQRADDDQYYVEP